MGRHLKFGKTRERNFLNNKLKMKVIDKFESGQSAANVAKAFDLTLSTVNIILRDKERIKEDVKNSTSLKSSIIWKKRKEPALSKSSIIEKKREEPKPPVSLVEGVMEEPALSKSAIIWKKREEPALEMEKLLLAWIHDRLKNNEPFSLPIIKSKAKSIFEEQKVKFGDSEAKFVASDDWLKGFKVRSNIPDLKFGVYLTDAEHLEEIISEDGYTAQQVYNVSEIELSRKSLPGKEQLEDKITVVIGCNANGDHKLKPLFVNPSYLKTNALCKTIAIFAKWFYEYFILDVENYCVENCIPFKILLIINDIPWHSICVNHPNVKILLLPRRICVIQPMNQAVISAVRASYILVMLADVADGQYRDQSFNEFLESYTIQEAMKNMTEAWEISNTCLNASWKRLCPYFVNEECSENGENLTRDILKYAELLQIPINFNDVTEFLND